MKHTIVDSTGKVMGSLDGSAEHIALNSKGKTVVPGEPPSPQYTWNGTVWVAPTADASLAALKTTKLTELQTEKTQADGAGFPFEGNTFPSDATSQTKIAGLVSAASATPGYTATLTTVDGKAVALTGAQLVHVQHHLNMLLHGHDYLLSHLTTVVNSATVAADITAVCWTPQNVMHKSISDAYEAHKASTKT